MYKFKFSIVMAVYNVEQFLAEAIESVLQQDIGFEENVQLILVNDGSKDSSGKICDLYQAKYPHNIFVVHKENGGVSSARNKGLEVAEGKYVNFLDSDDKLSPATMKNVYKFFEEHYDEVDVVSIPIVFFEGQKGNHVLNYKFNKGSRVIDLNEEYNCIQLSLSSSFVKAECAREIFFDMRLKYAEDAKECIKILLKKQKLGVVKEARYDYRKRLSGEASALQNATLKKAWYMPYLKYFSNSILNKVRKTYGSVPLFVQYTLMYDLQWRFKVDLSIVRQTIDDETETFINECYEIASNFDDEIIIKQRYITIDVKCNILMNKYKEKAKIRLTDDGSYGIYVRDVLIQKVEYRDIYLDFLSYKNDYLIIEGCFDYIVANQSPRFSVEVNGEEVFTSIAEINNKSRFVFDQKCSETFAFKSKISIKNFSKKKQIKFFVWYDGVKCECKKVIARKNFPLVESFDGYYCIVGDILLTMPGSFIFIEKNTLRKQIYQELIYLKWLLTCKRLGAKKFFVLRCVYFLLKPFMPKDIWLISDRINKADDNGEAFFKFLHDNKLHKHTYFVIKKDSADNAVVKQYGKVLDHYSLKHRLMHLFATKIISSAGDDYVFCPFWGRNYIKDILWNQKRIFLQHGIIIHDLSGWLNKYSKNLDLFITAGKAEYNSILEGNYFYDDNVVKLTGLARYDRLENKRKKIITIMPTWRTSLTNAGDYAITGKDNYNDAFFESDYFKFYNDLISHPELLACAKRYGYKIKFMPHPRVIPYVDSFSKNDLVEFCHIDTKYRDIFGESALVLTDYSSVAFDFAYLRKPVIYTHFDKEEFYRGQIYDQGYFDYERDGFGEVEYNLEDTAKRIIEYIKNDCQLKDTYRERIDKFFAFNDRNNCRRIYDEVIKL